MAAPAGEIIMQNRTTAITSARNDTASRIRVAVESLYALRNVLDMALSFISGAGKDGRTASNKDFFELLNFKSQPRIQLRMRGFHIAS